MRQDAAGAGHRERRGRTPVRTPGLDARGCDPRLCLAAAGRALRHDGVLPQSRRLVQAPGQPRSENTISDTGSFSKVTSVQRVNTVGGLAPKGGCSQAAVGTPVRINYTADY